MSIGLRSKICFTCGIEFAVPPKWFEARVECGKPITCPNGHKIFSQWADGKSREEILAENDKLCGERDDAQKKLVSALADVDRLTARLDQFEADRRDTDTDTPASDPTHSTPRRGKNRKAVSA